MSDWPHPTRSVERSPAEGRCDECGADDLAEYPVLAEAGWLLKVKCQHCLSTVTFEPWNRTGYVTLLEDVL